MRRALPLALPLLLAACAGPAVETAKVAPVAAPSAWRTDAGPTTPIDIAWWQSFGDPAMTALVERALSANLDIAIAGARIRDAKAQERLARAQLLPTLDAAVPGSYSRSVNAFGQGVDQEAAQPQVTAAWEADLFGRLSDQASAARSAWLASQAARDSVRLSIAGTVASGYVTLLALDARLAVARQTLEARSEALRLARSRTDAGYSPQLELAQAQAEYQATAQIIPPLEQLVTRQENALRLLVDDIPGPVARGASLAALAEPAIPDGLPSQLLTRRPDVAQAEFQLATADHSLAAARKRFLPQLRLSGSAGLTYSSLLPDDPIKIWSLGASILAPLFEGGRLRAGAESAGAQRDVAAFAYRRTALNAFREVDDALAAAHHSDEQVAILQLQRDALANGFRLATNRYRAGYSPYLEQLDAQRGLLGAELGLIQAQADALTARIALYQAMGGGWSNAALADAGAATESPAP
jgi:NodT family efflux transporter outer membrane factor (OMF) lipoprotein